jgi:hypothetical protein
MICVLCLEYIETPPDNLSLCSFCNHLGKLIMIYKKELIGSILENNIINAKLGKTDGKSNFTRHLQYQITRLNNA